ncbi:MAG: hypothetical protein SGJ20_00790 [Planctomycetota bacterium]|nr:hypothetical protein [Planctomycetota bacterium]
MTMCTATEPTTRVMNALKNSLVCYLQFARPWIGDAAKVGETIRLAAESHRTHVERLGKMIVNRHARVTSRAFPADFTGLNDLSLQYLLPLVIADAKQIIQLAEDAADALKFDAKGYELIADVIDSERGHLRMLQRAAACRPEKTTDGLKPTMRHTSISRDESDRTRRRKWRPSPTPSGAV